MSQTIDPYKFTKGKENPIYDKYSLETNLYPFSTRQGYFYETNGFKKWFKKNNGDEEKPLDTYDIAKEIVQNTHIFFPKEYKNEFLIYRNGKYYTENIDYLDKIIINYLTEHNIHTELQDHSFLTKLGLIKKYVKSEKYCSITEFDTFEKQLLNVKNGILDYTDFDCIKLLPHTPELKFCIQIPINYDPKAQCPEIEKEFKIVLGTKYLELVYQHIGDALIGDPSRFAIMLALIGTAITGKTTVLNVIQKLIGINKNCSDSNIAHESFEDLQKDPHSIANLENKLANISDEIPRKLIRDSDKIKRLTSKYLKGNRKYGKEFNFINHTKHFFSGNKMPEIIGIDQADFRRFHIIKCIHIIKEKIENYEDLICTESELSGLLNKALDGLKELLKNHGYEKKYSETIEKDWSFFANPLVNFLEEYIEYADYVSYNKDDDEDKEYYEIDKDLFFNVYNQYLTKNNLPEIKNKNILTRQINYLKIYNIKTKSFQRDGERYHVYTNIKFNNKATEEFTMIIETQPEDIHQKKINEITKATEKAKESIKKNTTKPIRPQEIKEKIKQHQNNKGDVPNV